jgi:hypothetical protein
MRRKLLRELESPQVGSLAEAAGHPGQGHGNLTWFSDSFH